MVLGFGFRFEFAEQLNGKPLPILAQVICSAYSSSIRLGCFVDFNFELAEQLKGKPFLCLSLSIWRNSTVPHRHEKKDFLHFYLWPVVILIPQK